MNRLLGLLPPDEAKALALSATVPMALRGAHEVSSYAPSAAAERVGRSARAGRRRSTRAISSCTRLWSAGDGRPG